TNYLGNYWGSDYTGSDGDGDGLGDTAYDIAGSTDKDYRPLMTGFENYPTPAAAEEPDLTPTSLTSTALYVNQPSTLTATIRNNGTAAAGSFNVSLKVEDTVIGSDTVASLGAGSSVPVVFIWTPDAAGTFNLTAIVDSDDAVAESDEANNELTEEVTISEGSGGLADTPWPMFGHDLQHTGVSPYIGVQEPTVKWSVQTSTSSGGVSAQPVIDSDGTIYIGTVACNQGKFYAFNPDGTEKWTFSPVVEGSGCPGCNEFWGSAAIAADGTIYVGWCSCYGPGGIAGEGMLYALDSDDGSVKWQFGMVPYRCSSSSTIGADGTIYWGAGNKIYAVNPDGTEKWNFTTTADERIRDAAIGADGTIYAAYRDHNLYAINPDGTEKWHFETGDKLYYYPVVGSDGTIYVGSKDHNLYAINPDGTKKWQFDTGETVRYPAVGSDGTIYVSAGNTLWAINPDGTERWHFTTGDRARTPAIGADGTIYFGSYDKKVYALNPDGTEKWSFTTDYEIGGAPSIAADGTIYVPSGKATAGAGASRLYAIGQSTPTPPTSFLISGNVTYDNGNPVINPAVTVTNLATSEDFTVKTNAGSNYYLTLTDSTHITAGDTIRINASDGSASNETDHPVTASEIETGGFVQDMTIESGELPDLTVTGKSEEWISLADATYNVTCTVANIGTAGADASTTAIEINGTVVATDPVPALAIGESHTSTLGPFTLSGENDTIRVCADSGEIINEHNETNNCLENVLEAPSMPDLIVWVALKTPGYVNEDNILGVRVKNTGTGDAGSFNVSLAIDGTPMPEQTVPPLAGGETTEIEYAWAPTELGGHALSATVDTGNDVEESDETNNDYTRTSVIISSTDWAQFNYDASGIGFSPSSAP
ncbi:MAG: PQQ-binding-like beta-propeller repeat protein, partial [Methanosarcinales archaeon]|nr:PQQ-binding-like beta-propeller repeat protein [Methanosarcinales archaeon]